MTDYRYKFLPYQRERLNEYTQKHYGRSWPEKRYEGSKKSKQTTIKVISINRYDKTLEYQLLPNDTKVRKGCYVLNGSEDDFEEGNSYLAEYLDRKCNA